MKKKWYRGNGVKGIWIVIELCMVVVLVLSALFLANQYSSGTQMSDFKKRSYIKTNGYAEAVYVSANTIRYGVLASDFLKTENAAGKPLYIDLKNYAEQGNRAKSVEKKGSGLVYSMENLVDWAKSRDRRSEDGMSVIVCKKVDQTYAYYSYDDFMAKVLEGKITFSYDESRIEEDGVNKNNVQSDIMWNLQNNEAYEGGYASGYDGYLTSISDKALGQKYTDVWNFPDRIVEGAYAPLGADSLLEMVNDSEYWNGRLSEINTMLSGLLGSISDSISAENSLLEVYSAGNTNLTYFLVDEKEKKVYTNAEAYQKYQDWESNLANFTKQSSYILIRPRLDACETNMQADLGAWKEMLQADAFSDGHEFSAFAFSMDTDFPIGDSYAQSAKSFEKNVRWTVPAMAAGVGALLIFLVGLVWLTVTAGRKPEDDELYLMKFDHLFTEVAAGLIVALLFIPLSIVLAGPYGTVFVVFLLIFGSTSFCLVAFAGYLSLVRRIKAGTLWKNSLLLWLLHAMKRGYRKLRVFVEETAKHLPSAGKMIGIYVGYVFVNFLLTVFMMSMSVIFFFPFLLVWNGFVLWWLLKRANGRQQIIDGLKRISGGELNYKIPVGELSGEMKEVAEYINRIGEGLDKAVENSVKNERMKTELITNVSHDIKTPLTSIINYIDLLKRENLKDPKVQGYLEVLEQKAQRLKVLTEDVVEASKVSTGNITLNMSNLNLIEMIQQVSGEFEEKFGNRRLDLILQLPEEEVVISADGRRLWRVFENIYNNAAKYAMEGTRIYAGLEVEAGQATFTLKNISAQPLNIRPEELTERFIRGDVSRSTEGSGLGLSIAKSLTQLLGGTFELYLDGDLFKVILVFQRVKPAGAVLQLKEIKE